MSVIYFCPEFICCPYYRGVRYSGVSARRELTVFPKLKVSKTKSRICTCGSQRMRPKGQVTLVCYRKGRLGRLQTIYFLVVDVPGDKPPLLSGKDAQALDCSKIYADETNAVEDEILQTPQTLLLHLYMPQNAECPWQI